MDIRNSTLIHTIFIFLCIGCVHNKRRKLKRPDSTNRGSDLLHLNSLQILQKYGYSSEMHPVTTEDGYIVNLFRIPRNGPPVLLVHGIADSSDCWLVLGPTESIAYQLADAGFDVWLYNARGNKYSRGHISNPSYKQYWNFSYEEMGTRDLPATIDYILSTSQSATLSYVGFSQGTTIFLVLCSMRPEYNQKIKHAILLAPVAWVSYLKYPFIDILTENLDQLTSLAEYVGLYELFPSNLLHNTYHAVVCNDTNPAKVLCDIEFYVSYGIRNITNISLKKLPAVASHIPAGTSTKTFVHFMQEYASKRFQRYDYGFKKNLIVYGSPKPPVYDMSLVSVPITLMQSESDWFSTYDDVRTLRGELSSVRDSIVLNKSLDFTHLEFVYGARVKTLINDRVVKLLDNK